VPKLEAMEAYRGILNLDKDGDEWAAVPSYWYSPEGRNPAVMFQSFSKSSKNPLYKDQYF
jgi:hypothetical protein